MLRKLVVEVVKFCSHGVYEKIIFNTSHFDGIYNKMVVLTEYKLFKCRLMKNFDATRFIILGFYEYLT